MIFKITFDGRPPGGCEEGWEPQAHNERRQHPHAAYKVQYPQYPQYPHAAYKVLHDIVVTIVLDFVG